MTSCASPPPCSQPLSPSPRPSRSQSPRRRGTGCLRTRTGTPGGRSSIDGPHRPGGAQRREERPREQAAWQEPLVSERHRDRQVDRRAGAKGLARQVAVMRKARGRWQWVEYDLGADATASSRGARSARRATCRRAPTTGCSRSAEGYDRRRPSLSSEDPSAEILTARLPVSSRESERKAVGGLGRIERRQACTGTRWVGTTWPVSNVPSPRRVMRRIALVESGPPIENTLCPAKLPSE